MKVLLVTKKTNQEILKKRVRALKIFDRDFLKSLESSHKEHFDALKILRKTLTSEGIECAELKRGMPWPQTENFDIIVTLGGDGTILSSSHQVIFKNIPIIGIRSSDESIGHLCALDHKNLENLGEKLRNKGSELIKLQRLYAEVTFQKNNKTLRTPPVLNDFLFANSNPASTTRYSLTFNGLKELHKSSGIWISTPAGSTAAIGTIGAKKQKLSDSNFQYKVRELYPHPSKFKLAGGLFDPDKDVFTITNFNSDAILAIDGQHGCINLTIGDKITFKRAPSLLLFSPEKSLKT